MKHIMDCENFRNSTDPINSIAPKILNDLHEIRVPPYSMSTSDIYIDHSWYCLYLHPLYKLRNKSRHNILETNVYRIYLISLYTLYAGLIVADMYRKWKGARSCREWLRREQGNRKHQAFNLSRKVTIYRKR